MSEQHQNPWQPPIDSLPDMLWEVMIVGAGPAGSMAALHLASRGHRVLLIDKQRFPRDKICGDGLIPDAIRCLQRAGLYEKVSEVGWKTKEIVAFSPSRIRFEVPGDFLTVKRLILDEIIAREAVSKGATFCQGTVQAISRDPDGMIRASFSESSQQVRARIGIIATGADISLLKNLGMVSHLRASAVALRCYVRSSFNLNQLVISFDRSVIPGYAWIFPVGGEEYNVGCGMAYRDGVKTRGNLKEIFHNFVTEFPLVRELMKWGEILTPLQGALLRCGLKGSYPFKGKNILAIGETIGATFPFTGEGIGKAMETGELAASIVHKSLVEGNFQYLHEFPRLLEEELRPRYLGYQIAENWLSKAWLNDLIARRARKSRFLQNAFAGIITETVDPRTIFSVWGILKSLWM